MKEEFKKAFTEVDIIINMMPQELKIKIPNSFVTLIEQEKDNIYEPKIKEPLEEQDLLEETIVILGLIYRDFLCSKEERIKLQEQDLIREQEFQEELSKQYSVENIFEKNKKESYTEELEQENNQMIVYQEKWYHTLLNVIKRIFRKK